MVCRVTEEEFLKKKEEDSEELDYMILIGVDTSDEELLKEIEDTCNDTDLPVFIFEAKIISSIFSLNNFGFSNEAFSKYKVNVTLYFDGKIFDDIRNATLDDIRDAIEDLE